MIARLVFVVVATIAFSGCGVESAPQSDSGGVGSGAPGDAISLHGSVVRANGSAASGVTVTLMATGDSGVTTAQGTYSFDTSRIPSPYEFLVDGDSVSGVASIVLPADESSMRVDFKIGADNRTITATTPAPTNPGTSPSGGAFDADGNTTSFSLPAGIVGNAHRGKKKYFAECASCHSSIVGRNDSYPTLKRVIEAPPMNLRLAAPDVADIVAFLNFRNGG